MFGYVWLSNYSSVGPRFAFCAFDALFAAIFGSFEMPGRHGETKTVRVRNVCNLMEAAGNSGVDGDKRVTLAQ